MSSDLLTTIAYLSSAAFVGGLFGWLTLNWEAFAALTVTQQKAIKLVVAVVLSVVTKVLLTTVSADTWATLQPWWAAIFAGIEVAGMEIADGLAVRYQYWQEAQFIENMQAAELKVTGEMLEALFPKGTKHFRTLITNAQRRDVVSGIGTSSSTSIFGG